jgi:RNA polymerase sigma-70 factor (ECF subfamily)
MLISETEKDLILYNRIKDGNKLAFNTVFEKYYADLCEFSFLMINSKQLAEEIVADVLANMWIKKSRIEISHSLKAYLYKSTRNMTISYIRKKKTNTFNIEDDESLHLASDSNPEFDIIQKEQVASVENILNIIPERSRMVFRMHRIDKLKYREISEILEISQKTVEKHMGKAIKIMREYHADMNLVLLVLGKNRFKNIS